MIIYITDSITDPLLGNNIYIDRIISYTVNDRTLQSALFVAPGIKSADKLRRRIRKSQNTLNPPPALLAADVDTDEDAVRGTEFVMPTPVSLPMAQPLPFQAQPQAAAILLGAGVTTAPKAAAHEYTPELREESAASRVTTPSFADALSQDLEGRAETFDGIDVPCNVNWDFHFETELSAEVSKDIHGLCGRELAKQMWVEHYLGLSHVPPADKVTIQESMVLIVKLWKKNVEEIKRRGLRDAPAISVPNKRIFNDICDSKFMTEDAEFQSWLNPRTTLQAAGKAVREQAAFVEHVVHHDQLQGGEDDRHLL